MSRPKLLSSVFSNDIAKQNIIGGALITVHLHGVLVCSPAPVGECASLTTTRLGERFMDNGNNVSWAEIIFLAHDGSNQT